jgi:hypothetical protein
MKYKHIVAFILLCQTCFGQRVEKASSIAPEDLGAYKWLLSATAQENQVVIFRVTTVRDWNNEVTTEIHDDVSYSPGKKKTGSAFFINPRYFDTSVDEPKWNFQTLGGSGWIEGKFAECSSSDDKAEITFESKQWGKTKKIFQVFIKSYDEASKLYDGLPKISPNVGWGWSGSPKTQSEQGGAGQPATASEAKPDGNEKPQSESKVAPR